jgi:hypothetical protein
MRTIRLRTKVNTIMSHSLQRAEEALAALDQEGCQVHALVIRDGRPVFLIEPPTGCFTAAVQMHRNNQGKREYVWMAEVAGCKVEWTAPAHLQAVGP